MIDFYTKQNVYHSLMDKGHPQKTKNRKHAPSALYRVTVSLQRRCQNTAICCGLFLTLHNVRTVCETHDSNLPSTVRTRYLLTCL
jgi:hypothetical protein